MKGYSEAVGQKWEKSQTILSLKTVEEIKEWESLEQIPELQ